MLRRAPLIRMAALLLLGALALHELRFLINLGHGGVGTGGHGHGYLMLAGPVIGTVTAILLGSLVVRSAVCASEARAQRVRVARVWPLAAAALLAIFTAQELVEGAITPGHPSGFDGVFGDGGWVSIPLSLAIGAGIALLVRITQRVAEASPVGTGWLSDLTQLVVPCTSCFSPVARTIGMRRRPLAFRLAGRGPPAQV